MSQFSVQLEQDPLGSAYPVPWHSLLEIHAEAYQRQASTTARCRSSALYSPDGQYAAYSHIQMQVTPDFISSQAHSVLYVNNLQTKDLHTIMPHAPIAQHLLTHNPADFPSETLGMVSMMIPVSWSSQGELLLSRVLEAVLGSELLSDYAVIWDAKSHRVYTLAPSNIPHTHAVLEGWSTSHPDQVLFRAGMIGDLEWPLWRVTLQGETLPVEPKPFISEHWEHQRSIPQDTRVAS